MTHEEILSMLGDYVDYLIANSSAEAPMWNIEKVRSGKPNKWNYIDGCMITACLSLYKTTGDEKYLEFSKEFIDYFVQPDGAIKTYDPKEYNLDNVNQGKNLFTLYDIFGDEKYRKAIETIRSQLATQPRTKEGNFWHKDIYPWQVWLDGTYMAQPFYMEYETRFNKMQGCIDSYKQFMNIKKHMRDEKTGLYYHGYDESRKMYWADPETGCSRRSAPLRWMTLAAPMPPSPCRAPGSPRRNWQRWRGRWGISAAARWRCRRCSPARA